MPTMDHFERLPHFAYVEARIWKHARVEDMEEITLQPLNLDRQDPEGFHDLRIDAEEFVRAHEKPLRDDDVPVFVEAELELDDDTIGWRKVQIE